MTAAPGSDPSPETDRWAAPWAGGQEDRRRHGDGPGVQPIQSVERAAAMLSLFSLGEPELGLAEITERLGMNRATAHRYGMTLRSTGMLRYDHARGVYSLGARIIELGRVALANLSIAKVATPFLERLSEQSNETAVLSIWNGSAPVVVTVVDRTDRLVSITIRPGSRLPVVASAQGLLFLAHSAAARAAHADVLEGDEVLESRIRAARDQGLTRSEGFIPGIAVIAAPILQDGEIAATIALVCQRETQAATAGSPAAGLLRSTAAKIGAELGAHG